MSLRNALIDGAVRVLDELREDEPREEAKKPEYEIPGLVNVVGNMVKDQVRAEIRRREASQKERP